MRQLPLASPHRVAHRWWSRFPQILLAIAALWLTAATAQPAGSKTERASGPPRVFLIDVDLLAQTRRRVAADAAELAASMAELRQQADEALKAGPFSVMDKPFVPPSGDKHDYMSLGPYWWPDPNQPDGLPYIRRDGEVNPDGDAYDRKPLGQMTSAVETLALAYYLTSHAPYAEHAARLLRVWFLDEATRMNPHLEYGQAIPGRTQGRGIGIIDTAQLARLVDAVGLLGGSQAWTPADQRGLESWFGQYLQWLRESRHGRDEDRTTNNHATWYDVQVAAFALFVGQQQIAREVLQQVPARRIATQIEADGRQPLELARTRSWDYSVMNLRGMFELAMLGRHVGVDLWNFQTDDGRSLRRALEWLVPYATGEKDWDHRQIHPLDSSKLVPLLRRASIAWQEPRFERLGQQIGYDPADRLHLLWPHPVRNGVGSRWSSRFIVFALRDNGRSEATR
jgi:hypothetical protein